MSPQPAEQNLLHIENMSKGFVCLALLADVTWKVLCKYYQQTEKKTFTTKDVDSGGVLQKVLFEE